MSLVGFARIAMLVAAAVTLLGAEERGTVTASGLPVPGAIVTATQGQRKVVTSTDESGGYVLKDLAPGSWAITVEALGFENSSRTINVPGNAVATWELKIKQATPAPAAPPRAATPQAGTFRRLGVNQTTTDQTLATLAEQPVADAQQMADLNQNANESFLVNGSLSRGLQMPREEALMFGPGGPGMMSGPPPAGAVPGMEGPQGAGPAGGPGGGGPGMGPPGGFGGPAGPGGRGGFGGPGMRGPGGGRRPGWQGRQGTMVFGNRGGRGRETFRGNLSFSLHNSALDARPYSLTGQTVAKPSYAQARIGISGGGQLRIPGLFSSPKTFFFVNYFATRSRNPSSFTSTMPTELERTGDFSQSVARGAVVIYDPLTQQPFPGNKIPESRISAAAKGLLQYFPLPNQSGEVQNYQFVTSSPQNTNNFSTRVMHSLTQKDRISGSFNFQSRNSSTPQLFQYVDTGSGRGISLDLSWSRNLSTGLINNVQWRFSRDRNTTTPYFANGEDVAALLGIIGTSNNPLNYGPPNLSFTNFGGLTDASASLMRNQSSAVSEALTWVRGKHTLTAGGQYQRNQLNNRSDQNGRGALVFSGLSTSAFDSEGQPLSGTGFDFADFLLGLPQSSTIRFGSADTYFRGAIYNAFVQDDWRPLANLSLNLGIRYEYATPLKEKYNRIANLDIAPGFTAVSAVTPGVVGPYTGKFPDTLIDPDRNNFAPRVGLAWKPFANQSLTVRAGYGVYFNGSVYNQIATLLAQQPPFANSSTFNTSSAYPLTLENPFSGPATTEITNTYAVDRNYQIGYAQTWNLSIQRDLPLSMVMELGYLGTKGTRLDIQRIPNRAAPGSPLTAEERRLIGNAVGFTFDSSDGNSIYHAAQARLSRRFRRGLSLNALYTFSKSIDDVSSFGGGGSGVVVQDDKNLRAERGLSSFDRRHTLTLMYMFSTPSDGGTNRLTANGWYGRLMRNWTLGGGITAQSGLPFTATVLGNRSDAGGTGAVGSSRADATGLPVTLAGALFNPLAFTLPPAGRFGNAGRNTIPGPASFTMNLSVNRSFRIGEGRHNLDLRVDSTNVLNTMNVTRIGTTVNSSSYGLPLATGSMRTMQASLRFRF